MSIIHEALKKAERQRQSRPTTLPLYGRVRTARRRWYWRAASSVLICLTTMGSVSTGLWLHSHTEEPLISIVDPMVESTPAKPLGGEDQTVPQTFVSHLAPTQRLLAGVQPALAGEFPSSAASPPLSVEARVTAQTIFERARE